MNSKDTECYRKNSDLAYRTANLSMFVHRKIDPSTLVPSYTGELIDFPEGMEIDLGSLHLVASEMPGHTPGFTAILLPEERVMIFGDGCGNHAALFDEFSTNISTYLRGLRNVKKHDGEYDIVLRNHGNFVSTSAILDNVIECCELVLEGKDDHAPFRMNGNDLFAAKRISPVTHYREDGKEGNILYTAEKGC